MNPPEGEEAAPAVETDLQTGTEEASTEAPAGSEVITEKAPEEEVDHLQQFLSGEADPQWYKDQATTLDHEGLKDFKVSKDVFDALPDEAKQLIGNIRRMGDRKASKAADAVQSLEQRERTVKQREIELQANALGPLQTLLDPRLLDKAKPPEGDQPDPATRAGQEWLAKQQFSELMEGYFGTLKTINEERTAEAAKAKEESAKDARLKINEAWVSEVEKDPRLDALLTEHNDEVRDLIVSQLAAGKELPAETAFKMVLAAHGVEAPRVERTESEIRKDMSIAVLPRGKGSQAPLRAPEALSGTDREMWYANHPEALAERGKRYASGGSLG